MVPVVEHTDTARCLVNLDASATMKTGKIKLFRETMHITH